MTPVSAVVTTFNNEATIAACLESLTWADEIVVLDSCSTDKTREIARHFTDRVHEQPFRGYSQQKQDALDLATNDWALLIDSDEVLSPELQVEIQDVMRRPHTAAGYTIPRREQLFWVMCHPKSRHNCFLRLFDRRKGRMNGLAAHETPEVDGSIEALSAPMLHYSDTCIAEKVTKLNSYSSLVAGERAAHGHICHPLTLILYPPFVFLRTFLWKRNFLNGWAGFVGSVCMAFYAFMKYAKIYEQNRTSHVEHDDSSSSTLPLLQPMSVSAVHSKAA